MSTYALALMFATITQSVGLPNGLLNAICYVESNHKVTAYVKHDGKGSRSSHGVCQVQLATAQGVGFKGTEADLMDPHVNALMAGLYLKKQLQRYDNDIPKAVAAYNAGTAFINNNGLIKNRGYVIKVFKAWANLHEKPATNKNIK